jgi:hypothetical protein
VPRAPVTLLIAALIIATCLTGCSRSKTGYQFPDVSPEPSAGVVNLLADPSFESDPFVVCTVNCTATSGWSGEHKTTGAPTFTRTTDGVVTGSYAVNISYDGQPGDNGGKQSVELFSNAKGPTTTAGHRLTFTLWFSGSCIKCAPFVGIEAFTSGFRYLGENDQYFTTPSQPQPVQVSYVLPAGASQVAAYIQIPEIYSVSKIDINVDNAQLIASNS